MLLPAYRWLLALCAALLVLAVPASALAVPAKAPKAKAIAKKAPVKKGPAKKGVKRKKTKHDLDGDGIPNRRDKDIDGDRIPNSRDRDVDGDRIPNRRDKDVDGDGIPNVKDRDVDGDRIPNVKDRDVDGDGIVNSKDRDMDGDGTPNSKDRDMDGDGQTNLKDLDLDGDGVDNATDADPNGAGKPYGAGVGAPAAVGISDQSAETFAAPLFRSLGMRYARYVTPWNSIWADSERLDKWLAAAANGGFEPLVSFNHTEGDQCPGDPCGAPSASEYEAAFRAFRARYPWVTTISPWNEANHQSQPTAKDPALAATYYNVVYDNCPECRIVAADVLDSPNLQGYLRGFMAVAKGNPRLWGLHNYSDTNRFRTSGTDTMLATVPGEVWVTETGGIVSFTTSTGEAALPFDEGRAIRAMDFLFNTLVRANSSRITRVYVYHWKSDPKNRWDAGLVDANGTPRGTYDVVRRQPGR